jgi:hypothetical protein
MQYPLFLVLITLMPINYSLNADCYSKTSKPPEQLISVLCPRSVFTRNALFKQCVRLAVALFQ